MSRQSVLFQRPIRIPKHIQVGTAEPHEAAAGEPGSWRLPFILAKGVPQGNRLLLYLHGKRNNRIEWDGLQIEDEARPGYVGLQYNHEKLHPVAISADGGSIEFQTPSGGLEPGVKVVAYLGGKAGTTAPKVALPNKFALLFSVPSGDRLNTSTLIGEVLDSIVGACLISVRGGRIARLRAHAPSRVVCETPFSVLVRPEDVCGNTASTRIGALEVKLNDAPVPFTLESVPHSTCVRITGLALDTPGIHRLQITDAEHGLSTSTNPVLCSRGKPHDAPLWGMIHGHTEMSDGVGTLDHYFTYMRDQCALDFGATSDHDHLWETPDEFWRVTQEKSAHYNQPGTFTAFLGYEWAKWRRNGDGDRNVYYLTDMRPLFRSDDGHYPTPADLFAALRSEQALVIPHHSANIGNHCDWKDHDPSKERLVEIYSVWGSSERSAADGNPFPMTGRPENEVHDGFVQRALAMGWRVGFTAGGDDHLGHPGDDSVHTDMRGRYRAGLLAVYAPENTRKSIFEALYERRCYGTTGARMIVDFRVNGHIMGSELSVSDDPSLADSRTIAVTVHGTDPIATIEIVRNNEDVHVVQPDKLDASLEWTDTEPLSQINLPSAKHSSQPFTFYYVRITQADGEMAWLSPVWILA